MNCDNIYCSGCGQPIVDSYYLVNTLNHLWHSQCLVCTICGLNLEESYFTFAGSNYCKYDYQRLFCSWYSCSNCEQKIEPDSMVIKVNSVCDSGKLLYFHIDCFTCFKCDSALTNNDYYALLNDRVYCLQHCHQVNQQPYSCSSVSSSLSLPASDSTSCSLSPRKLIESQPYSCLEQQLESTLMLTDQRQSLDAIDHLKEYKKRCNKRNGFKLKSKMIRRKTMKSRKISNQLNDNRSKVKREWFNLKGKSVESKNMENLFYPENDHEDDDDNPDDYIKPFGELNSKQGFPCKQMKRKRTSFKHDQLKTMKHHFNINHNPDTKDLEQLSTLTKLSKRVLQVWFQNARAKWRKSEATKSQSDCDYELRGSSSHLLKESFESQTYDATLT